MNNIKGMAKINLLYYLDSLNFLLLHHRLQQIEKLIKMLGLTADEWTECSNIAIASLAIVRLFVRSRARKLIWQLLNR